MDTSQAWRRLCAGAVQLPGDRGYDQARPAWNRAVDQRPAVLAYPADVAEVSAVLRLAAQAGLRVAPQATGHNPAPLGDLSGAVLLRTSGLLGVSVDGPARRARVAAGARWSDVVDATVRHGLAPLHSSTLGDGVVGYGLGGGIGCYARTFGLFSDTMTAIEVVTPNGDRVRCDATHERELFWALRGGGGNFGVVTALEFRLLPLPGAYAGMLMWDHRAAARVLARWARWASTAPAAATTSLRLLRVPELPGLAGWLCGRNLVVVQGCVLGDPADAEAALAPLRELHPDVDTFRHRTIEEVAHQQHGLDRPMAWVADSTVLPTLPPAAVDAFLTAAGPDSGTTLVLAELRHLGGALAAPGPDSGVLSHVAGEFLAVAMAPAGTPAATRRGDADLLRLRSALAPFTAGVEVLNFAARPVETRRGYPAGTWARLRRIRAEVDPAGLLRANHQVP